MAQVTDLRLPAKQKVKVYRLNILVDHTMQKCDSKG